jgi:flagellar hook-associated protein 2
MGTTASAAFTGSSSYASQLQQVITRAVSFATLPITQLQNQQSTLTDQQGELQTLGSSFQSLQNALDSINSAAGLGSFSATSDATSVATASVSTGALPGTYSIDISSIGSQTNTISSNGLTTVSDPSSGNISASTAYTLTVDGTAYQISDSGNSLNALAQAINASGANVEATVVNVGGSSSPDYRLSVQGAGYAPTTIQLNDGTHDLLNTITTGSNVTYQVNGEPATPVGSDSRNLAISPGVTVNVLTTGTANVTVAQSAAGVANALSSFVAAYNSTAAEVQNNRGQNGGALAGQSVVSDLSSSLQSLAGYTSNSGGSVQSLADLGLTFDDSGTLQFDQSVFNQAASNSLSDVLNFVGSETGGGFLGTAESTLTAVTDPVNGLIEQQTESIGTSITNLGTKISSEQDTVNQLQTNLTQQMATADATIAALEDQVTQITDLFSAMQQQAKTLSS